MVVEKVIPNNIELINLFGINDNNLKYIKKILRVIKIFNFYYLIIEYQSFSSRV